MNTLTKTLITLIILMALAITLISSTPTQENTFDIDNRRDEIVESSVGRFLAQQHPNGLMRCDKNPRLCGARGSPGPDCCNKNCVDVMSDKQNCGLCGKKCKNTDICCTGSCVNPTVNMRHCGGCNNACSKGDSCVRGMCNYA